MSLNILIGGGTGFIGQTLVKLLRKKGHSVKIISRREGLETITWDKIRNKGLPKDTNAVVNLSGAPLINPSRRWNDEYKKEVYDSRIETCRWLKDAIVLSKVKPDVWVSVSGVGYYATSPTAIYDEDSDGGKDGYLAILSKEWEKAAELPKGFEDVRHVVVRAGAVLGKDGGVIKSMIWPFRFGLGGPIGSGKQAFPWIHVDDIAGIFAHVIESVHIRGILNAVAPAKDSNEAFAKELGSALSRPAFIPVPEIFIRFVLGEERVPLLLEGQWVEPRRTLELGYKFVYPKLDDALKDILK